jgi:hypothetical protein
MLPDFRFLSVLSAFFAALSFCSSAFAETIVTHETDRHFYKDGRLLKLDNQYEMTYHLDLEKDTLTRTRIYDFLNKKITPDESVYHIERQLLSHPTNAERYVLKPVLRAVGQTSADGVELLVVGEDFVETVLSSADELVLSRARRMR